MYEKPMVMPKILELRLQHNYTQEYVANQLEIPLREYQHIETVDSRFLRLDTLEKMAILYNTSMTTIAGWES